MTKQRGLLKARALAAVGFFFFSKENKPLKRGHVDFQAAEPHWLRVEIHARDVLKCLKRELSESKSQLLEHLTVLPLRHHMVLMVWFLCRATQWSSDNTQERK